MARSLSLILFMTAWAVLPPRPGPAGQVHAAAVVDTADDGATGRLGWDDVPPAIVPAAPRAGAAPRADVAAPAEPPACAHAGIRSPLVVAPKTSPPPRS